MNRVKLIIAGTLLFFTAVSLIYLDLSNKSPNSLVVSAAAANPQDSFTANCNYNPDSAVFKQGRQVISHPTQSAVMDTFVILLPVVNQQFTRYPGITLLKDDRISVRACGCVQTGGTGKTWKRYVNPSGPNSAKLYHGVIALDNFIIIPPQPTTAPCCGSSPTVPGLRISDMIDAQNRGFKFQIRQQTPLVLGFEDDDYGDNGYWKHDDGTEDQCRNVGGAAVEVTIRHKTN